MSFVNAAVDLDALPRVERAPLNDVDPRYPRVVLGIALLVELPALVAATLIVLLIPPLPLVARVLILAAVIAFLAFLAWFVYTAAKVIRYAVREHDVIVQTGVFWRTETVQPIKRIQHVEQVQGPIDKRLGLCALKLYSAGTGNVSLEIPGLAADVAARIAAFILDFKDQADGSAAAPPTAAVGQTRKSEPDDTARAASHSLPAEPPAPRTAEAPKRMAEPAPDE